MDSTLIEIIKDRLWRIIHHLEDQTYQSVDDIKHETECLASAISHLTWTENYQSLDNCLHFIRDAINRMDTIAATRGISANSCQPTTESGKVGRPAFIIPVEHIEFLISCGFKLQQMADLFGVSKRTMSRRLSESGLSLANKFSTVDDNDLDKKVEEILHNFPNIGYRSIRGHLQSEGFCIQEDRVRESMRRVDLEGVIYRRMTLHPVHRRKYSVPAPNSLWHIDGYHKLIRYQTAALFIKACMVRFKFTSI